MRNSEFTVEDSFHFPEEIVNQQPDFFMGSLDFLFTSIPLEKTIEICTNTILRETKTVEGKSEFKELLLLATKDWHLIFDRTL